MVQDSTRQALPIASSNRLFARRAAISSAAGLTIKLIREWQHMDPFMHVLTLFTFECTVLVQ